MPGNLAFDDFDFLIPDTPPISQNEPNIELRQQSKIKRLRISELIADNDELVGQLKQLQDFQRTASEVSELYQKEKQQRLELEDRTQELNRRCAELEKQLDVQQLNCEQLQAELDTKRLPVDTKHMATVFMQLAHRVDQNLNSNGLLRREISLVNKLRDFCKSASISIPTMKSPTRKHTKSIATTAATQASHATQTDECAAPSQPVMCSTGVQYEQMLTTRDQGTQHKNMTTTRGTTTASFIKKHDVGTCFPEPKPPLTAHQILNKMLAWNTATTPITPLSPIREPEPEPKVQLQSVGTCTDLCNIQREVDFLPSLPTVLKYSNSRPPSRAMCDSVKDELTFPPGCGQYMAKELFNFLPPNGVLTNLPPHVFEEVWHIMGQMLLVVSQRRSANPAMSSTMNQADFSSWFDAIYESSLSAHTKESVVSTHVEPTAHTDTGTDPIVTLSPPEIGVELTPIRLPRKPVSKLRIKRKKLKRHTQPKPAQSKETAVNFLSNLNAFTNPNCDNLNIELDAEEQQFLQLTSAAVCIQQLTAPPARCKVQTEVATESVPNNNLLIEIDAESEIEAVASCKEKTEMVDELAHSAASCKEQTEMADELAQSAASCKEQMEMADEPFRTAASCKEQREIAGEPAHSATSCKEQREIADEPFHNAASYKKQTQIADEPDHNHNLLFAMEAESEVAGTATCMKDAEITTEPVYSSNLLLHIHGESEIKAVPCCKDQIEIATEPIHSNDLLFETDEESWIATSPKALDKPACQQRHIAMKDPYDSDDSFKLVIDTEQTVDAKSSDASGKSPSTFTPPHIADLLPAPLSQTKRKRKTSKCDAEPAPKRLTRLQVKQMELLETESKAVKENSELNKESYDLQSNCIDFCSPASPVNEQRCDDSDIIEIPLESPGVMCNNKQPKALIYHVANGIKSEPKPRGWRKQQPYGKQLEQLEQKVFNYLKNYMPLNPAIRKFFTTHENVLSNALIRALEELELSAEHLDRLFTVLNLFECSSSAFTESFMCTLEQRLFRTKERPNRQLAQKYVRLYLEVVKHQASLTQFADNYINPARLLLAKILYHYNKDMTVLVMEVLSFYPTVLPHREERAYDNSDALITVIKHLLMCHKYEVEDKEGVDRALISQLRYVYHFKPYEPTKQQVVENLVEKLKAGRLENLSYALALFCRRSEGVHLVKNLLEVQLLPLINSYCDLCKQSEEYDERMECLLQCVSMIVKQLPLDQTKNISVYIAIYKRVLVAVPRPTVQQAAVQAILRTQRFGYAIVCDALKCYRPSYELSAMTRAMLRSFALRRQKYKLPH